MNGTSLERWLEWLRDLGSYRPGDFLMFAPRTYWRLFELHNEAWWPLPLVFPALGLVGLAMLAWRRRGGGVIAWRVAAAGLAALAAFIGGAFVVERYAAISWAALGLVGMWAVLGLLLLALAAGGQLRPASNPLAGRVAVAMALLAMLAYPLLAPMAGRPLMQAEVFGLAPDPTALAVLAWLLAGSVAAATGPVCWVWRAARALALALCALSAAMLALLDEWQALVPLLAAGAAGATAAMERRA